MGRVLFASALEHLACNAASRSPRVPMYETVGVGLKIPTSCQRMHHVHVRVYAARAWLKLWIGVWSTCPLASSIWDAYSFIQANHPLLPVPTQGSCGSAIHAIHAPRGTTVAQICSNINSVPCTLRSFTRFQSWRKGVRVRLVVSVTTLHLHEPCVYYPKASLGGG